jgi:hypothetical protein
MRIGTIFAVLALVVLTTSLGFAQTRALEPFHYPPTTLIGLGSAWRETKAGKRTPEGHPIPPECPPADRWHSQRLSPEVMISHSKSPPQHSLPRLS